MFQQRYELFYQINYDIFSGSHLSGVWCVCYDNSRSPVLGLRRRLDSKLGVLLPSSRRTRGVPHALRRLYTDTFWLIWAGSSLRLEFGWYAQHPQQLEKLGAFGCALWFVTKRAGNNLVTLEDNNAVTYFVDHSGSVKPV
jgi:hypothetical protein